MSETNGNTNGNATKITVPFMGGSVTIKPGGSFTSEKGDLVEYGPCVDLSAIADSKRRVEPGIFRNMIDAVSKNTEAMSLVKTLA